MISVLQRPELKGVIGSFGSFRQALILEHLKELGQRAKDYDELFGEAFGCQRYDYRPRMLIWLV
jgi:hypothetical protein